MSSDICDEDWKKHDYVRSISKKTRWGLDWFRPSRRVIVLYPVLLYYAMKRLVVPNELDCYLYRLENRLIDMTTFQFYYNLNKHVPDCDSWLGLRSTSWAATAIGPLAWVTFVISSLAPEHVIKPDNFGSRSGYRPIGKHWSDALVEPDFMRWDPVIGFILSSVLTAWTSISWCCSGLMICSSHLDESTTYVKSCTVVTSLCTFSG
jgi:hypothetical protein